MKVVHVLRKPCSEGTVAANVLRHGTGALNIDACRVPGIPPSVPQPKFNSPTGQIYGMKAGEGRNGEMSHATGRWPANLVLQHLDGCVQDGTKKVGSGNVKVSGIRALRENPVYGVPNTTRNAPDSYGKETITAWACGAGCPVAGLDAQSESSGASRYFKQVGGTVSGEE